MGAYTALSGRLKGIYAGTKELEADVRKRGEELMNYRSEFLDMLNAQRILAAVSDENMEAVLRYVTGIVNKTLAEIFKSDTRKITLKKRLFAGTRPHIIVELTNGEGVTLDMNLQSGTGLSQVVSGLYTLCLIEIRKGWRLIVFDERFSGLHSEAKKILSEIIKIFAEGGFQFMFVEYYLNDMGKLYNIEKPGNEAKIYPMGDKEYKDSDVYIFSGSPDMSVLDDSLPDEEVEEDMVSETVIS